MYVWSRLGGPGVIVCVCDVMKYSSKSVQLGNGHGKRTGVDGRYALRNIPKTDRGVYPLVAHVRRSTRLSLRFSPAGQRSRVK